MGEHPREQKADSSFKLGVALALSKVTGFIRTLAVIYAFGVGASADAFNLSNTTPNMVHDLIMGGIINAALLPGIVKNLNNPDKQSGDDEISAIISVLGLILLAGTIIFELSAPFIISAYSLGSKVSLAGDAHTLAVYLLYLFAPQLLFYGFITLATVVLNAHSVFSPVGYSGVANNIVSTLVLVELAIIDRHPSSTYLLDHRLLLVFLGIGITAGVAAQFLWLFPSLSRLKLTLKFKPDFSSPSVRKLFKSSSGAILIVITNQLALFVTLALSSTIAPGDVSTFTYAYTIFQLPFGIVTTAISSTLSSQVAILKAKAKYDLIGAKLLRSLKGNISLILPTAAVFLVLSPLISSLVLFHTTTSSKSSLLFSSTFRMLAIGLPGFTLFFTITRALLALEEIKIATLLYIFENSLNIGLAFLLKQSMGLKGIALSISISYSFACIVALAILGKLLANFSLKQLSVHFLMLIIVALGTAIAAAVFSSVFSADTLTKIVYDALLGVLGSFLGFVVVSASLTKMR